MTSSVSDLKKYRKRFAAVLVLSLTLLVATSNQLQLLVTAPEPSSPPTIFGLDTTAFVALVSLITSVVSLVGLVITTGIAWRKERREARAVALDEEKKRVEVALLHAQLEDKLQEKARKANDPTDCA